MTSLNSQKTPSTVGHSRKWGPQKTDSLNDLVEPAKQVSLLTAKATDSIGHELQCPPQPRFNNTRVFYPMTVALPQSDPGLVSGYQEVPFLRDHGCIMKTVRLY